MTRTYLLLSWLTLAVAAGCSLERSPIVDQRMDAGGIDAPIPPGLDGGGDPDVPRLPDVPVDVPRVCAPACVTGQFCLDGSCYCDADMCMRAGGECVGSMCQQCGRIGDACCSSGTACLAGGACVSGRCEAATEPCGGSGEPCCEGVRCTGSSLVCLGGRCGAEPTGCGGDGQMCCPGEACLTDTSCQWGLDLRQLCRQCGGFGEGCCTFGERCEGGRTCGFGNVCL